MKPKLRIKIPGKILLAGEYTVLEGGEAIAATVDRYLTIDAYHTPSKDGSFSLEVLSNQLVGSEFKIAQREDLDLFSKGDWWMIARILKSAFEFHQDKALVSGSFLFVIQSQLDRSFGIGSSSALAMGLLGASALLFDESDLLQSTSRLEISKIMQLSYQIQKQHQDKASGYDVLTQAHGGGILRVFANKTGWSPIPEVKIISESFCPGIKIIVGGSGNPTGPTTAKTYTAMKEAPNEFWHRYNEAMDHFRVELTSAVKKHTFNLSFHKCCEDIYKLQTELSATAEMLTDRQLSLFEEFSEDDDFFKSYSIKTTGAGGEDCMLLFHEESDLEKIERILLQHGFYFAPFQCSQDRLALLSGPEVESKTEMSPHVP